jgi:hypothetical protein
VESPDGRVVVVGDAQELAGVVVAVADGVDARAPGLLEQARREVLVGVEGYVLFQATS